MQRFQNPEIIHKLLSCSSIIVLRLKCIRLISMDRPKWSKKRRVEETRTEKIDGDYTPLVACLLNMFALGTIMVTS